MAHSVSGIVTSDEVNESQRLSLGLPILKTEVSSFLAVSDERVEAWSKKLNIKIKKLTEMTTDEGPNDIDNNIVIYFARLLEIENYALVETEYFGGVGIQSATLYKNGTRATQYTSAPDATGSFISAPWAINTALKELGIKASGGDLFETIGLNKFRFTNEYYTNVK